MNRIPSLETFRNLDYEPDMKLYKVRAKYKKHFYQCMVEDCGTEFTSFTNQSIDYWGNVRGVNCMNKGCPDCGSPYYMWKGCE